MLLVEPVDPLAPLAPEKNSGTLLKYADFGASAFSEDAKGFVGSFRIFSPEYARQQIQRFKFNFMSMASPLGPLDIFFGRQG
jgi:hypothetical protein